MSSREMNGKEETGTNTRDFIAGAIIGAVAGAAAALLLTPRSGRDLRTSINQQATSILEKTDQVKDRTLSKSNELASAAKEKASSIAQTVTQQSTDLIHKVKDKQEGSALADDETKHSQGFTAEDIQKKLAETQKAFDETELKLNH